MWVLRLSFAQILPEFGISIPTQSPTLWCSDFSWGQAFLQLNHSQNRCVLYHHILQLILVGCWQTRARFSGLRVALFNPKLSESPLQTSSLLLTILEGGVPLCSWKQTLFGDFPHDLKRFESLGGYHPVCKPACVLLVISAWCMKIYFSLPHGCTNLWSLRLRQVQDNSDLMSYTQRSDLSVHTHTMDAVALSSVQQCFAHVVVVVDVCK